ESRDGAARALRFRTAIGVARRGLSRGRGGCAATARPVRVAERLRRLSKPPHQAWARSADEWDRVRAGAEARLPATVAGSADPWNGVELSAALRLAEARFRILSAAVATAASGASLGEACRSIGRAICDELEWDFLGIWMLDAESWALYC